MSDSPIRVAHIIGKWIGGGVESVVMNYYRNINKNVFQFDFLCDSDSTNIPYEEINKLGGRVILIPPYQKLIEYEKTLVKIFKENKYKIVHSHINVLSVFRKFVFFKIPFLVLKSFKSRSVLTLCVFLSLLYAKKDFSKSCFMYSSSDVKS